MEINSNKGKAKSDFTKKIINLSELTKAEIEELILKHKTGKIIAAEGIKDVANNWPYEMLCWEVDDKGKTIDSFIIRKA